MQDEAQALARRAAARLTHLDQTLPMRVEAVLAGAPPGAGGRYDPATAIAFASFLVSAAALAWKIWQDTRPPKPEVARTVRVELVVPEAITDAQCDAAIAAVVRELPDP